MRHRLTLGHCLHLLEFRRRRAAGLVLHRSFDCSRAPRLAENPFANKAASVIRQEDAEASEIFAEAKCKAENITPLFCYAVSPSAAEMIVDVAATLGISRVILGAPQRHALMNLLRGNVIREVSNSLPEIDLLVYA